MTAADVLAWLIETTAVGTAALLLVLLLRVPVRALFGARVAYTLWTLLPLSLLAVSLPAPVRDASLPVSVLSAPYMLASAAAIGGAQSPYADIGADLLWPLLLWISGVVVVAALFARQQLRFVHGLGRVVRGNDGLRRAHNGDGCPAVIGAWSPYIVLPVDFEARYPVQERELVLAHENAHLARGDTRVNLGVVALRCVYWFNPLLHWASARFRNDQELACDATVLSRHPYSRRAYAGAMLKTQLAVLGLPVGCHWQSSQSLKERILMLKKPLPGPWHRRGGRAAVAAVLVASSYAAWALQPVPVDRTHASPDAPLTSGPPVSPDPRPAPRVATAPTADEQRRISMRAEAPASLSVREAAMRIAAASALEIENPEVLSDKGQVSFKFDGVPAETALSLVAELSGLVVSIKGARVRFEPKPPESGARPSTGGLASADHGPVPAVSGTANVTPAPPYPPEALAGKVRGRVLLHLLVATNGSVKDVRVVESEPQGVFDAISVKAARKWTLQPRMKDGQPVEGWLQVPVTFSPDSTYRSAPPEKI